MTAPGFPANHSALPFLHKKGKEMKVRQSIRDLKEAPEKAIKIAILALGVAILALFISIGRR